MWRVGDPPASPSQPGCKSQYLGQRSCSSPSRVRLFATPWTVAHQAPLSMGFSRQEHWSGLPQPPPRDLPHPGIAPASLPSPALAGGFFTTGTTREAQYSIYKHYFLQNCLRANCRSIALNKYAREQEVSLAQEHRVACRRNPRRV